MDGLNVSVSPVLNNATASVGVCFFSSLNVAESSWAHFEGFNQILVDMK